MSAKYFLDTNIFIYSFDQSQPQKKKRSLALITEALQSGNGIISTQVIQEFLNVATRKFSVPLKPHDCKDYLHKVLNPLCQVFPSFQLYETTLDIQNSTGYSFYDSLIIAGALQGGCGALYSEDLHAGQVVNGITMTNPYA